MSKKPILRKNMVKLQSKKHRKNGKTMEKGDHFIQLLRLMKKKTRKNDEHF